MLALTVKIAKAARSKSSQATLDGGFTGAASDFELRIPAEHVRAAFAETGSVTYECLHRHWWQGGRVVNTPPTCVKVDRKHKSPDLVRLDRQWPTGRGKRATTP